MTSPAGAGADVPDFTSPCATFSCGDAGECITMNGNPTCRCDAGFGAVSREIFEPETGALMPEMECVALGDIEINFPALPPIGANATAEEVGVSRALPVPGEDPMTPEEIADMMDDTMNDPPSTDDDTPPVDDTMTSSASAGGGGCAVGGSSGSNGLLWLVLGLVGLVRRRR
jgi:MYXO-CTERM domain-containing protein